MRLVVLKLINSSRGCKNLCLHGVAECKRVSCRHYQQTLNITSTRLLLIYFVVVGCIAKDSLTLFLFIIAAVLIVVELACASVFLDSSLRMTRDSSSDCILFSKNDSRPPSVRTCVIHFFCVTCMHERKICANCRVACLCVYVVRRKVVATATQAALPPPAPGPAPPCFPPNGDGGEALPSAQRMEHRRAQWLPQYICTTKT